MPEVNVIGTLQRASYLPDDCAAAYARFKFVCGPGWTLLDGQPQGQTQIGVVDEIAAAGTGGERSAAWDHPLDVHYSCATLTGWPQLVITLWKQDSLQRNEIAGYGTMRIPTSPGVHQAEVALWRPEGTWWQETAASFFGGGLPHLTDPALVPDPASGAGRHRLATVTVGTAAVDLQVLVKGFGDKGVAFTEE